MVTASEPGWLHTAGQAAGTILLLELGVLLVLLLVIMSVLAVSMWWVRRKIVPVLRENAPRAQQYMSVAQRSSDRVVSGVAEFYGRRQQIETSLRVLLFGGKAAERVHEEALAQASEDLQMMTPAEEGPGPENAWTPRLRTARAAATTQPLATEPARAEPVPPSAAAPTSRAPEPPAPEERRSPPGLSGMAPTAG
jgi:hypothetical protein